MSFTVEAAQTKILLIGSLTTGLAPLTMQLHLSCHNSRLARNSHLEDMNVSLQAISVMTHIEVRWRVRLSPIRSCRAMLDAVSCSPSRWVIVAKAS